MANLIEMAQEFEKKSDNKKLDKEKKYHYRERALDYYEMAIANKSGSYDIRSNMGRILNKQNNFKESEKCFDIVLTMDSEHIDSLFGLGISYLGQGKWKEALTTFEKALKIDDTNANLWYYSAIILKYYNRENADKYYEKFLKLDNGDFRYIRKNYKFFRKDECPIAFLNSKMKFENKNQQVNIGGFKKLLSFYGLDNDEIILMLRTLSKEELEDKFYQFNDAKYEYVEKSLIYKEFFKLGLTEEDVDDMIQIDGIENVKKEIISISNKNPFPIKTDPPNIVFLVDSYFDNYSELISEVEFKNFDKFVPVGFASKYNLFKLLRISKSEDKFYRSKIDSNLDAKKLNKIHSNNLKNLHRGLNYIEKKYYKIAISAFFKNVSHIDPELYANANFLIASTSAHIANLDLAIRYFDCIENRFRSLKYNPYYLFNKGNLLYDLGKFEESIRCYELLDNSSAKILQGCAYYKLGYLENAKIFIEKGIKEFEITNKSLRDNDE